jgi:acetyl esterase
LSGAAAERPPSGFRRIIKWIVLGLLGLILVLAATALAVANSQDGSIKVLQYFIYGRKGSEPNSFAPPSPPADTVRANGTRVVTNLTYGQEYPNSFLDIWYAGNVRGTRPPTVIYMHGGGWFMGSKEWGDPLAGGRHQAAQVDPIAVMAQRGFNVVNMDYALAPAYRYPVPVRQLNQAIAYLRANSARFGLDMTRVFIMGGSAGAQMSAQYGLLLSNPAYAAQVGIKPAIVPAHVKGVVLYSAPLKVSGSGWRFNAMLWSYLGTKDLEKSPQARQMDIAQHVTPRYPPTYITDGNQSDTFPEHAKAMAQVLRQKGVDHVFTYYEPSEAKLDHGYAGNLRTKQGRENFEKTMMFMMARSGHAPVKGQRQGRAQ